MKIEIDTERNVIVVADRIISLQCLATLVEPDTHKYYKFVKADQGLIIVSQFDNQPAIELAEMVIKYFGPEPIDPRLDSDIALRDKAQAVLEKKR